jgi:hypothetical protein
MITFDDARQILDLAGGSIRYWARDIVTEREAKTDIEAKPPKYAGDLLALAFKSREGVNYHVTVPAFQAAVPPELLDLGPLDGDLADAILQTVLFGRADRYLPDETADEARAREEAYAGMRVEEDEE